jgi:3-methyl-2-oxobutanoate hydroxymethyltransferase
VDAKVTIPALQQMKRDGQKIVAMVVYDYQMAQIVDRAGIDIVSAGDSVGMNLWGLSSELDVTLDQMVLTCQAVRRGVKRAVVSCDFPLGEIQKDTETAVKAAERIVKEGGADLVKLDGASAFPETVRAMAGAGISVWAQFGITPHTAKQFGGMAKAGPELAAERKDQFVQEAKLLEEAGAVLLDFTNSGPVAGPEVVRAVSIPVIGGLGGGPWLDGRVRAAFAAVGYLASSIDDDKTERYAHVARTMLEAVTVFAGDVRGSRQIRGAGTRTVTT